MLKNKVVKVTMCRRNSSFPGFFFSPLRNTLFIVLLGLSLISCGGGGGSKSPTVDISSKKEFAINSDGGTIEYVLPDNKSVKATLEVSAGAVSDGTIITIIATDNYPPNSKVIPNTVFDFGPNDLVFSSPATLTIWYDPSEMSTPESHFGLYKMTGNKWEEIDSTVDTKNHSVTAMIESLSLGALGIESVPPKTEASPENWSPNTKLEVTLICTDQSGSGCDKTYYTVDGSDPTPSSNVYSEKILIENNTTLSFFSVDTVGNIEAMQTKRYVNVPEFRIGGTVSGLKGTLELQNTNGDNLTVTSNSAFTFATSVTDGTEYAITIFSKQAQQICDVFNHHGTIDGQNVTDISVVCSDIPEGTYTVGGVVNGLKGTLVLQNNEGDDETIITNGPFTFNTSIEDGADYNITISSKPADRECTFSNSSGVINSLNVTNVILNCNPIWINPEDINDYINPNAGEAVESVHSSPKVAMDDSGNIIVVWIGDSCLESNCRQVYMIEYRNENWSQVDSLSDNISPDGFPASSLDVAMSNDSTAIIVWEQATTTQFGSCGNFGTRCSHIYMSEYRNGTWKHPQSNTDYINQPADISVKSAAHAPQVVMDDSGNAIITWYQKRSDGWGVYKSEYRNGSWTHPSVNEYINPKISGINAINPRVTMNNNGTALIVWQANDLSTTCSGGNPCNRLYISEYRNSIWTHPDDIASDFINPVGQYCSGISCMFQVDVAMDNNDNAIIVWKQHSGDVNSANNGAIFMSEYRNGNWAHPSDLNDAINPGLMSNNASFPQVDMNDNDNAIIVWQQYDGTLECKERVFGLNGYEEFAVPCNQTYMSETSSSGWIHPNDLSVHISPSGQMVDSISSPEVAISNNGDAVITWAQVDGNTNSTCKKGSVNFCSHIFMSEKRSGSWIHPENLLDYISPTYEPTGSRHPQVAIDSNGNSIIAWDQYKDIQTNIFKSDYK